MNRWTRRAPRHVFLALASAAATAGLCALIPADRALARLSMATAYAGLGLLALCLTLGPVNVLRGRANPVSTDLRRDIGIWAGMLGLVHVVFGLQVHMGGNLRGYFFAPSRPYQLFPRLDAFGIANHAGLAVTLILIVLLALSNDRSLRALGTKRWKWTHRSIYVGFAALVGHGAVYQLLEKRQLPLVSLFVALAGLVLTFQLTGFLRRRSRLATAFTVVALSRRPRTIPCGCRTYWSSFATRSSSSSNATRVMSFIP